MNPQMFARCVLVVALVQLEQGQVASNPNIVLFLADDLGYGDLGCYGNDKATTPNIDGLAGDGLRFTRMYTEPGDTSARAAILTGQYPVRYGMLRDAKALPILRNSDFHSVAQPGGLNGLNGTLLPTFLKYQGYRQAMIGKWNLGVGEGGEHLPLNLGFDLFYGTPVSHGPQCTLNDEFRITDLDMLFSFSRRLLPVLIALLVTSHFGLLRKPLAKFLLGVNVIAVIAYGSYLSFAVFNPKSCVWMHNQNILEQPYVEENMTLRMTKKSLEFVSAMAKEKEPFFLFMSYLQPHYPPFVSPWFRNRSGQGLYKDSVMEMDWSVGAILNKLKDLNVYKDTLIIFASDNGAELTNPITKAQHPEGMRGSLRYFTGHSYDVLHLKGEKQTVLEGGIRVPAIITWPAVIQTQQQTSVIASLMDILPTIRDIVQPGFLLNVDGISLLPRLKDPRTAVSSRALMHYCDISGVAAVTFDKYKVYSRSCSGDIFNPPLLFDVEKDPTESKSLSFNDHETMVSKVLSAVDLHKSSLSPYPSQFTQLLRPWLYLCHNPPFCKKQLTEKEDFHGLFE
ncbi:steryl-sulfatase-like [Liolophura sinensis]|uniref:steryl-sulfatase-like n=1 Tax=Liolophura sinensis TaxID=3198878 RepID=UPI00315899C1